MLKLHELMRLRLGGTMDNAALSAIGGASLVAHPALSLTIGPVAGVAMSALGGGMLADRLVSTIKLDVFENRDEESITINSSQPPKCEDGMHIGYLADTGEPLVIPTDAWTRHVSIIGMTGVGKTVLANWLMFQQVMRGGGLMFVDGKVDADNVAFMRAMCAAAGREHDLLILNPGEPENSNTYNPFLHGDPDEIAARTLALVPTSENNPGTDYYRSQAVQSMTNFIGGLKATGRAYNALDIALALQSDEVMRKIIAMMNPNDVSTDYFVQWYDQFTLYGKDGRASGIDMKKMRDTLGGIIGKIYQFGTGNFAKICNAYNPEIVLEDVILQNKILYVALPTLGRREAAMQFGRLLIGDLRSATARIQGLPKHRRPNPSFLAFLDEAGSYLTQAADTLIEQARSAGVTLCPAVQTKANYDAISVEFRSKMSGNSLTRMYFKTNEPETASWIEEMCGMEDVVEYSLNESRGVSRSSASISTGKIRGDSESSNVSVSQSRTKVPRVSASMIGALGQGECIVQYDGSRIYHVKIPFIDFDPSLKKALGPVQINRQRVKGVPGINAFRLAKEAVGNRFKVE